jgi:hypothetical protein
VADGEEEGDEDNNNNDPLPSFSAKELLPTVEDVELLRQIECGYEPVVAFSKFSQTEGNVIFIWLFMIRHTIQQMSQSSFLMYKDISLQADKKNLRDRTKSIEVRTHSVQLMSSQFGSSASSTVTMKKSR